MAQNALQDQYGQLTHPELIIGKDPFTGEIVEGSGYVPPTDVTTGGGFTNPQYNPKAFNDFMKMVKVRMQARMDELQPSFTPVKATALGGENTVMTEGASFDKNINQSGNVVFPFLIIAIGAAIIISSKW